VQLQLPATFYGCFAVPVALAIYWRKKPEFHRRLMLIASCALADAAFGRSPELNTH